MNEAAPVPVKLGRFAASKMVVQQSWAILKHDKELLWFPVLSAVFSLLAFAGFTAFVLFYILKVDASVIAMFGRGTDAEIEAYFATSQERLGDIGMYAIGIAYYCIATFIVYFFQAALFVVAYARMHGQDLSFSDGLRGASRKIGPILAWSLISSTVGLILNFIEQRSQLVGKIVAWFLGAAWAILTFFSLPALVIGNTTIFGAFTESASVIRKMWGETFFVTVGVGLVMVALMLSGLFVLFVLIFLSPTLPMVAFASVLFIVYLLVIAVVSSALTSIFKLALYEYARTGVVPAGFSPELIQSAIQKKA